MVQILAAHLCQQCLSGDVVGFAVQGEAQIVFNVVMAWVNQGVAGQVAELLVKGLKQCLHIATVVAIARTRIEQGVA